MSTKVEQASRYGQSLRALVVGFGSIGRRHARNIRELCPDCEILVIRRRPVEDEEVRALGAEIVGSLQDAIRLGVDFAVIANPSALHREAVLQLLDAGIACYIEKPVVTSRDDAKCLQAYLDRADSVPVTFSGCNLRMLPSLRVAKAVLDSGALGMVVRADFQVGQWLPAWRPGSDYRSGYSAQAALGGGVVFDLVHEFDAVRWLLGDGFEVRGAVAGRFSGLEIDACDTACALLSRPGLPPAVTVSMDYVHRGRMRRYTFVGDEGTLVWNLDARILHIVRPDGIEDLVSGEEAFDIGDTYVDAMSEFLCCVKQNQSTSQEIWEGLKSAELAISVMEAATA